MCLCVCEGVYVCIHRQGTQERKRLSGSGVVLHACAYINRCS